nr:TetR/AcrR family transcriptional regulator [uncultured Roseateles sp.]
MLKETCSIRCRRKHFRPQELLDAAFGLFVEKGFSAVRVEEVAARAGVSKGTLYLYYESKEDLLKAVIVRHLSADVAALTNETDGQTQTNADLLRKTLCDWWSQVASSQASGIVKLVLTEACSFPELAEFWTRKVIEPARQQLGRAVQQGMDDGEFRRMNPEAVVQSLLLPLIMMSLNKHTIGAASMVNAADDDTSFVRHHVDLVLSGLMPIGRS